MNSVRSYRGIAFIGDPHVAAFPPGHRRDDYHTTVMEKLAFAMDVAREKRLLPIILGDLFHVPRNNPNALLVELIELFRPLVPWVLLGNHDKYEARFSSDLSIAVLASAGAIRLIKEFGEVDTVCLGDVRVFIGASPDWTPLPTGVPRGGSDLVFWITHHNLLFDHPDETTELEGGAALRDIPGVDVVVNGHLHTPKTPVRSGGTQWMNPGSIVRIIRSRAAREMHPSLLLYLPGEGEPFQRCEIPHRPFEDVFDPWDGAEKDEKGEVEGGLRFIRGLEHLTLRRTAEGVGLRTFLDMNLRKDDEVDRFIWELYREVMDDGRQ